MTRARGSQRVAKRASLLALLVALLPAAGRAEPHFSLRSGLRCARCHTVPTGGGKRTAYGLLYEAGNLALGGAGTRTAGAAAARAVAQRWSPSEVGLGEITSWLAVGADLRVANRTTFTEEKPENTFEATEGTFYLELRPWPERVVLYLDEEIAAGGARNREAWALVRGPWATYLRGGRFLPPFGLRVLDDDAYTRRATGATFANPDLGFELGLELGPLSAAFAVTNGSYSNADTDKLKAFYGQLELNFALGRVGLSGMWNPTDNGCRGMIGSFGGVRLGRVGLQGEVDAIGERPLGATNRTWQLAVLAELDLLLTKGLSLRAGYDYHDADLKGETDRRQRWRFGLDLFPMRMVELKLYYVLKQAETAVPLDGADRLEVTLHVYL